MKDSSTARHDTMKKHNLLDGKSVLNLLGDTSHKKYDIFRCVGNVWTVAVGQLLLKFNFTMLSINLIIIKYYKSIIY